MNNNQKAVTARCFTTGYNGRSLKLLNEVIIPTEKGNLKTTALWDTGASGTCIAQEIADQLQLPSTGRKKAKTPSGEKEFNTYCVDLVLPNNVVIKDVPVMGSEIGKQGIGVLVGMDIIGLGDFAISNFNGHTQFTFRMPSLSNADFVYNPAGYIQNPIVKGKKIMPNEPCPCGSGRKYKQCCGKTK